MPDDPIPAALVGPLARLREASAALQTRVLRAQERAAQLGEVDGPTPEQLAEAAARPDAPPELRAVAGAVAEGRATWEDVAAGRRGVAPEIDALLAASGPGIARGLAEAEAEIAADDAAAAAEAQRIRELDAVDMSEQTYLQHDR